MAQLRKLRKQRFDWIAFAIFLSLILIGWLMIYAAGHQIGNPQGIFDLSGSFGKQSLFILVSFGLFGAIMVVDWKFWSTFSYPVYGVTLLLLVLVLLIGNTVKGSTSWFSFFGFSLQPSELAKFGTALAMASFLSYHRTSLKRAKHQIIAYGIFFVPIVLILLQPDAGSAIVFTSFIIVLFREGLPPWLPLIVLVIAALFVFSLLFHPLQVVAIILLVTAVIFILNEKKKQPWLISASILFLMTAIGFYYHLDLYVTGLNGIFLMITLIKAIRNSAYRQVSIISPVLVFCAGFAFLSNYAFEHVLEPHQQDRINVWLRPSQCDPQGSLYNVLQSKIAIGSGGLEGKGFLQGTMTKLNYVPEQTTDFIFSTIGEEQGFIGSVAIISLFLLLILRVIKIAERAKASFIRHYAYSVAGILFFHFFINIGMTMGLVPIIGIPLPFISYGGSSLIGFTLMISVLLKMDSNRY
jgi:rod shape determining protein RodA